MSENPVTAPAGTHEGEGTWGERNTTGERAGALQPFMWWALADGRIVDRSVAAASVHALPRLLTDIALDLERSGLAAGADELVVMIHRGAP